MFTNSACIIFHIIESKFNIVNSMNVELEFLGDQIINTDTKIIIDDKYFTKNKDFFKTWITLNIDSKSNKFIITLYYGENHISIFKSSKQGVCYEIIQIIPNEKEKLINQINFYYNKNECLPLNNFDTFDNKFRRRFLAVNCPIHSDLNIKQNILKKIKVKSSYKISIISNNIIVQEMENYYKIMKIDLENKNIKILEKIKDEIEIILKNIEDKNKINSVEENLKPFYKYFNQNLINKEIFLWDEKEFTFFYYYYLFKLILKYNKAIISSLLKYYSEAISIFTNIYKQLNKIKNVSLHEKICALVSLYNKLINDQHHKNNKSYIIGEYEILDKKMKSIKVILWQ